MGKIMKSGVPYGGSGNNASNIKYNNANSGLTGTTAQAAIDELHGMIGVLGEQKIRVLTESEYANLGTYDANTLYFCYKN